MGKSKNNLASDQNSSKSLKDNNEANNIIQKEEEEVCKDESNGEKEKQSKDKLWKDKLVKKGWNCQERWRRRKNKNI